MNLRFLCSKCVAGKFKCGNESCLVNVKCPHNQVYKENLKTLHDCNNFDKSDETNPNKVCGCDGDLVKNPEGKCVPKSQCPCDHGGVNYKPMSKVKVGCVMYECRNRRWHSSKTEQCPSK